MVVLILISLLVLIIPPGSYQLYDDGAPIAGTYEQIDSPLSFGERVVQLIRAPINGMYGVQGEGGFVDTELEGFLFGSVGVVVFIFALGAFISVSFATRSLEVAIAQLADRLRSRGWLLIAAIMVLFSLLGSTMGFSVEPYGFYALFLPLMAALGYDRMTTASMIILGCLTGAMASTVNPFSIGVASGEAGVLTGDGIVLRLLLWVVLTAMSTAWVIRYAQRVRSDPSKSLTGMDDDSDIAPVSEGGGEQLTGVQKIVLVITAATFGLLILFCHPMVQHFWCHHRPRGIRPVPHNGNRTICMGTQLVVPTTLDAVHLVRNPDWPDCAHGGKETYWSHQSGHWWHGGSSDCDCACSRSRGDSQ